MNARKAKVLRKMASHVVNGKGLPVVKYVEKGKNFRTIKGVDYRIPAPILVAAESWRGQYRALKRMYTRGHA